jgi:hypothetical protein
MSDRSGQVSDVSDLLHHWVQGDEKALHALIPVVYKELRLWRTTTSNPSGRTIRCRARL